MSIEITNEELDELTLLIKTQYGYDFSAYARASLHRRVTKFLNQAKVNVFDFKYNIINDKVFFNWFLESLSVNVTEMFRDPCFYEAIRRTVIPVLSTYPLIKIWHAGCSTGEEAFSMAILLYEAGLLSRTTIYATDMSMLNIEKAKSGIIPLANMREYTINYQRTGATADFSDYYTARYDHAIIKKELRDSILFSQHNLAADYVFNEFQLICCRNVLIYFNKTLQNHVLDLFYRSLSPLGFLSLGIKESLIFADCKDEFDTISKENKIYRLKTS